MNTEGLYTFSFLIGWKLYSQKLGYKILFENNEYRCRDKEGKFKGCFDNKEIGKGFVNPNY
jgi:hypothetical protein